MNKYLDTLMKDLGLNPNRKSNVLAEMFAPYRPSDYCGLLDEYLSSKGKKASDPTVASSHKVANGRTVGNGHPAANGHAMKAD